jgi:hypothetical protein
MSRPIPRIVQGFVTLHLQLNFGQYELRVRALLGTPSFTQGRYSPGSVPLLFSYL